MTCTWGCLRIFKFIAFVSYSNFDTNQSYEFKNSLNNLGFKAKFIQNKRLKSLLADTGYKSISSVFQGKVFLIYSENSGLETQKELLKLIDTSPQLFLLGCLENGLYFYSPSMVAKLIGLLSLFENQVVDHSWLYSNYFFHVISGIL